MIRFYLTVCTFLRIHTTVDEFDFPYTIDFNRCAIQFLLRDIVTGSERDFDFCHAVVETKVDLLVITPSGSGVQEVEVCIPTTLVGDVDRRVGPIRIPYLNASLGGILPVDGISGICRFRLAGCVHHILLGISHAVQQHPDLLSARPRILASGAGLRLCLLHRQL